MDPYSYISGAETQYVEGLYQDYKKDPDSVEQGWKKFFEGFDFAVQKNGSEAGTGNLEKELKVYQLIEGYRLRGHLVSDTNPIRPRKNRKPYLSLESFGLNKEDLTGHFYVGSELGLENATLEKILEKLQDIYTRSIGIEFMHIRDRDTREWVREKFEKNYTSIEFSIEKKKRILTKLNEAQVFEKFLHTKYVGQKRFSLEGGENTIPALDAIINHSSSKGVEEVVIGMAHRGRLNVLANILGKTYEYIFSEFEGDMEPDVTMGDGDVKYHLGFSSQIDTVEGKKVYLKLTPNPSHLEAVNPVVEGYTRGKGDYLYDNDRNKILPVLLHGDAALAGQGVAYEVVQMAGLQGYNTGGTIHFVINNQIGFTTDFDDARTSDYCTSLGKVTDSPILHINGDDAEAVVFAAEFAVEYRQKFGKDIFIDLLCYRRHGHNEGDDPKITQPNLYNLITDHPDPREKYVETLTKRGDIEARMAKELQKEFKTLLQDRLKMVKQKPLPHSYQPPDEEWRSLRKAETEDFDKSPDTSVSEKNIENIINALTVVPENFHPIRQIQKELDKRKEFLKQRKMDWALAELTAYGSLLLDGNRVRLSGQDSVRGTFSHRHAVLFDENDNRGYNSLNHIQKKQEHFRVYNSLLSEFAALGFEYGYALSTPKCLTIWEAQFGDFANGAQTIIDTFLVSGASKWQKMNGLVLFLPHGYEGQGPEHSNARPERFLQLSAELNMVVANLTTPANLFHILRRQMAWPFRKPLVIFTPKSLLRHPRVISGFDDFTKRCFQEVLDDDSIKDAAKVKRVLLCTGKVYFDLLERQEQENIDNVAIIRLEQIYPYPEKRLEEIYKKYKKAEFVWVQEEPKNMGAWTYLLRFEDNCKRFSLISRKASASPASGFSKIHDREQKAIVDKAFDLNNTKNNK